jgi:prepilin-type processing-associated H-X9-DG protein
MARMRVSEKTVGACACSQKTGVKIGFNGRQKLWIRCKGLDFSSLAWRHQTSPDRSALVFIDERDDSIDDGYFAVDMVANQIVNFPASYHGGSGGLTFADGHAEIRRWISPQLQAPQQMGAQARKWEFTAVPADNPDMLWLRARATVRLD